MERLMIKDEILACCNALGFIEGGIYMKEPDTYETLREIIKFLKRDNDMHEARYYLGKSQVVSKDLIPILTQFSDEEHIFKIVLKLLANLTHPIILLYHNKRPTDILGQRRFIDLNNFLEEYKQACINHEFLEVLKNKLKELVSKSWENTFDEDHILIEYILVLIRNILLIQPSCITCSKLPIYQMQNGKTSLESDHQSDLIKIMFDVKLFPVLIYLASNDESSGSNKTFNLHILEILYHIISYYDIDQLCQCDWQKQWSRDLQNSVERTSRSSNIGHTKHKTATTGVMIPNMRPYKGTYCVQGLKALSDKNDLITHSLSRNVSDLLVRTDNKDGIRKQLNKPKRKQSVGQLIKKPINSLELHSILRHITEQFLKICYNTFMANVKDKIVRNMVIDTDEIRYIWAISFFTQYARTKSLDIKYFSETLSKESMQYLVNTIYTYLHSLMMEKSEGISWGKRIHLTLMAYKQSLLTLQDLSDSLNPNVRESVRAIKANIFYVPEYREILIQLFKAYSGVYFPIDYLRDLIETTHIFLKMLKAYCKEFTNLMVMKKRKKRTKILKKREKKCKELQQTESNNDIIDGQNWISEWSEDLIETNFNTAFNELCPHINNEEMIIEPQTEMVNNNIQYINFTQIMANLPKVFDPTSDHLDVDEQRENAIYTIYSKLHTHDCWREAILHLLATKNIWPDYSLFMELIGSNEIASTIILEKCKEIFQLQLQKPEKYDIYKAEILKTDTYQHNVHIDNSAEEEGETNLYSENDDRNSEEEMSFSEEEFLEYEDKFDYSHYVYGFVNPIIIRSYMEMLSQFESNSPFTNLCIVKMLYKIAVEYKIPGIFFQVTYFQTFAQILAHSKSKQTLNGLSQNHIIDKENSSTSKFKELINFARYIVQLFSKIASTYPQVYILALVPKNIKESIDIFEGYARTLEKQSDRNVKQSDYYMENFTANGIISNGNKDLTSENSINKFVALGTGRPDVTQSHSLHHKNVWTPEQDFEIETLYNDYGKLDLAERTCDVVEYIQQHLIDETKTRRQITRRCKKLGLYINKIQVKSSKRKEKNFNHANTESQPNSPNSPASIQENQFNSKVRNEVSSDEESDFDNFLSTINNKRQNTEIKGKNINDNHPTNDNLSDEKTMKEKRKKIKRSKVSQDEAKWNENDSDLLISYYTIYKSDGIQITDIIKKLGCERLPNHTHEDIIKKLASTKFISHGFSKKLLEEFKVPNQTHNVTIAPKKIKRTHIIDENEIELPPLTHIFGDDSHYEEGNDAIKSINEPERTNSRFSNNSSAHTGPLSVVGIEAGDVESSSDENTLQIDLSIINDKLLDHNNGTPTPEKPIQNGVKEINHNKINSDEYSSEDIPKQVVFMRTNQILLNDKPSFPTKSHGSQNLSQGKKRNSSTIKRQIISSSSDED